MNNVRVLIIEDTIAESDALAEMLIAHHYSIAGIARTFSDALKLLYSCEADLVIIDVFLNGSPDGIAFAETLSITPEISKPFVFLTSSNDRQVFERARLTKPFSFLLKPYNQLELLYAIEMAVEKFYVQSGTFLGGTEDTVLSADCLFIKKKQSLKKVLLDDIIFIEVEERYCNIITTQEKFVVMISLTKIGALLKNDKFVQTHRNYLINTDKIEEIMLQDNLVILKGGHKVVLGEKHKDFIRKFNILR